MKNTIKKLALLGTIGLLICSDIRAAEGNGSLAQGALSATMGTQCAALGVGTARIALFRALQGSPSQPLTKLASAAFFTGAHCFAKSREDFRNTPLNDAKRSTISSLITGATLLTSPAALQPLPLPNGFIGRALKRFGTTTRVGIMAYGAYTLANANTSLWRHQ